MLETLMNCQQAIRHSYVTLAMSTVAMGKDDLLAVRLGHQ